jgi:hypothetical protein
MRKRETETEKHRETERQKQRQRDRQAATRAIQNPFRTVTRCGMAKFSDGQIK